MELLLGVGEGATSWLSFYNEPMYRHQYNICLNLNIIIEGVEKLAYGKHEGILREPEESQ